MKDLLALFNNEKSDGIQFSGSGDILLFKGKVTQEVIQDIHHTIEPVFENGVADPRKRKKYFTVLTEVLQNIFHHHNNSGADEMRSEGILKTVFKSDKAIELDAGNFMLLENVDLLKERISRINDMDEESLKAFYLESLSTTTLSDKGGAGLGLIEIARKSGSKLNCTFTPVNEHYAFFTLSVIL